MAKSNPRTTTGWGAGRAANGAAIVDVVHRRQAHRLAKLAFIVTWTVTAPVVTVAAVAVTDLYLALAVGILAGLVLAGLVGLVVLIWPALRLIWWWTAEITTLALILTAYWWLTTQLPWPPALLLLLVVLAAPWAIPASRRWLVAWCWCAIARHRLRTCFATFVRVNRRGSLPLIGPAWPTPAGERVLVVLRPGLSMDDLTADGLLSRLAVGCWAHEVRVARAFGRFAALVRIDITRRNPLSATVTSPLLDSIPALPTTTDGESSAVVGGLNLADIPDPTGSGEPSSASTSRSTSSNPASRRRDTARPDTAGPTRLPVHAGTGEDLTDWL
jgi:hypothetical protein